MNVYFFNEEYFDLTVCWYYIWVFVWVINGVHVNFQSQSWALFHCHWDNRYVCHSAEHKRLVHWSLDFCFWNGIFNIILIFQRKSLLGCDTQTHRWQVSIASGHGLVLSIWTNVDRVSWCCVSFLGTTELRNFCDRRMMISAARLEISDSAIYGIWQD